MNATDMPVPSYRLARESAGSGAGYLGRMLLIGGGLLAVLLVVMVGWWGVSRVSGGGVPVIEADPRPYRVRPDNPGGMQVQNQNELIFDRNPRAAQQAQSNARLAPEAEAPRLEALRQQVHPPPAAPRPQQAAAPAQQAAPAAQAPAAQQQQQQQAAPAANGRAMVQLGALSSEQAARGEYDRLARRMPDAFQGRRPTIAPTERDGQTLYRLRTGGFADRAAAATFCEQVRTQGGACTVVR